MTEAAPRGSDRVPALFWVCVLGVATFLAVDTAVIIERVGLTGARPPLSMFHAAVRIAIVVSAIGLMFVRLDLFERLTAITGAVAAGSSALYGFGMRSAGLSAVRLLSHLLLYGLLAIVAGRVLSRRMKAG